MATTGVGRVVLDTNVLLTACDEGRSEHDRALVVLNEWPRSGTTLYCSGQILREYVTVATRPQDQNGLGLGRWDATTNVRSFRGRMRFLREDHKVSDRLLGLIDDVECTGKQVHDANVVATMLVHGVTTLVTGNTGDFAPSTKTSTCCRSEHGLRRGVLRPEGNGVANAVACVEYIAALDPRRRPPSPTWPTSGL